MESYLGEIRMFGGAFAPQGWLACDGSLQNIANYDALYSLIGTAYGGDGVRTFGLPDLRGRVPVGIGQGPNLSNYVIGQKGGAEKVTLSEAAMPAHGHTLYATSLAANTETPSGTVLLAATTAPTQYYLPNNAGGTITERDLDISTISPIGAAPGAVQPHNNMMPTLSLTFIISVSGIYPDRP